MTISHARPGPRTERELLRRYIEAGDRSARDALVERNLSLVRALARRYAGRGEAVEDLEQVGAIGLIKAIDRYDLAREVTLTTYATPNIVGEIKRHFRDRAWAVRVPRGLQELHSRLAHTIDRLSVELGRSPSLGEIAAALDTTPEHVLEALESGFAYNTISLSTDQIDGEQTDPMDAVGAEDDGYRRTEERAALEPALGRLGQREREILRLRFEEGLTQTQIAERLGISQMHVSRLIRRSLEGMREHLT